MLTFIHNVAVEFCLLVMFSSHRYHFLWWVAEGKSHTSSQICTELEGKNDLLGTVFTTWVMGTLGALSPPLWNWSIQQTCTCNPECKIKENLEKEMVNKQKYVFQNPNRKLSILMCSEGKV